MCWYIVWFRWSYVLLRCIAFSSLFGRWFCPHSTSVSCSNSSFINLFPPIKMFDKNKITFLESRKLELIDQFGKLIQNLKYEILYIHTKAFNTILLIMVHFTVCLLCLQKLAIVHPFSAFIAFWILI